MPSIEQQSIDGGTQPKRGLSGWHIQHAQRNADVVQAYRDGKTRVQIIGLFNLTRSQIAGILGRAKVEPHVKRRPKAKKPVRWVRTTEVILKPAPVSRPVPAHSLCVPLETCQEQDGCRFIVNDAKPYLYCGAVREHADPDYPVAFFSGGNAYCKEHGGLVRQRATGSLKAAEHEPRRTA